MLPYDVYGGYGELVEQQPAAATSPTVLPEPDPGLGPHLAYAFQWWVFAAIALGGVVVLARREARESTPPDPAVAVPAPVGG
jgi:cytochrome oxidase assembly protein ShyY1